MSDFQIFFPIDFVKDCSIYIFASTKIIKVLIAQKRKRVQYIMFSSPKTWFKYNFVVASRNTGQSWKNVKQYRISKKGSEYALLISCCGGHLLLPISFWLHVVHVLPRNDHISRAVFNGLTNRSLKYVMVNCTTLETYFFNRRMWLWKVWWMER